MNFKYEYIETMEELRNIIKSEEGTCLQQVAFSTFHNALTQINFTKQICIKDCAYENKQGGELRCVC